MNESVFISYSHRDKDWLQRIHTHLKPLIRTGLAIWDDRCITPGSNWSDEIDSAINRCSVALLLVSPDFLASDFIHERELTPALSRRNKGELTILWAYLRSCLYQETVIGTLQAAHDVKKPLASLRAAAREIAITDICRKVHRTVQPADIKPSNLDLDRPRQCTLVLSGNADAAFLAKIAEWSRESSLSVVKIENGSIKLTLEGSVDALDALEASFVNGELETSLNRTPLAFFPSEFDERRQRHSSPVSGSDSKDSESSAAHDGALTTPAVLLEHFTLQQQQIIQLMLKNAPIKIIAHEMGVSELAIKSHISVIIGILKRIASDHPTSEQSLLTALHKESDA